MSIYKPIYREIGTNFCVPTLKTVILNFSKKVLKWKIENGKLKIYFALCILHFLKLSTLLGTHQINFAFCTLHFLVVPPTVILSFSEESSNNPAKQDFIVKRLHLPLVDFIPRRGISL